MILYLNDWKKYPSAFPDFKTTNASAIETAAVLKAMGVKNHLFVLALHDPRLVGVDPHNPSITNMEIAMIMNELMVNPWYFFREIVKAPPSSGVDPSQFKLNRANVSAYWLFFQHITTLYIKPRQLGKTFDIATLFVGLLTVWTSHTKMNLMTKDDKLRVATIKLLKDIALYLPPYIRFILPHDNRGNEMIRVNIKGNTLTTAVAQASPKAALNIGRGMTLAINWADEPPYSNNIEHTLPAMLAAGGAARDSAAENGAPYGNIFTTTAGRKDSKSGAYMFKMYQNAVRWSEKFFDSENNKELIDILTKNCRGNSLVVLLEYNHRQLGKTDKWLAGKIADALSDGLNAEADYLNIWVSGSSSSPIKKKYLDNITNNIKDEVYTQIGKNNYVLRWYLSEREVARLKVEELVMGVDPSDAIGKDDIGAVITRASTGEVVAAGDFNETNTISFSEYLVDVLVKLEKLTLIMERRSTGTTMLDNMVLLLVSIGQDPFARLFNWIVNDSDVNRTKEFEMIDMPPNKRDQRVYTKFRRSFGFATSGGGRTDRSDLYGITLMSALEYTSKNIHDRKLSNQLLGLTIRNGRVDHAMDNKDDLLISWLLCYWFLLNGSNLEFYGFKKRKVLSQVINSNDVSSKKESFKVAASDNKIIEAIEYISDRLHTIKGTIDMMLAKEKIKKLYRMLSDGSSRGLNLESFLESKRRD